jgi:hypothetical protein
MLESSQGYNQVLFPSLEVVERQQGRGKGCVSQLQQLYRRKKAWLSRAGHKSAPLSIHISKVSGRRRQGTTNKVYLCCCSSSSSIEKMATIFQPRVCIWQIDSWKYAATSNKYSTHERVTIILRHNKTIHSAVPLGWPCETKQDWKSFQSLPASLILVYCILLGGDNWR